MEHCPWIEKYRPTNFKDIVLDSTNKKILNNIIKKNYFPNLLFYGPPGTGKTTTIINLIRYYQEVYNQKKQKQYMIHLNASDDRGIDIIRNQIFQFVNTKTLFGHGVKFVILDEVDYMTKNAQQALRYLIQQYSDNVRFCLICNYISRIDLSLQNEFIRLRFCQLPPKAIFKFLNRIQKVEKLNLSTRTIETIQHIFKSDIRSMINFMQSNHYTLQQNASSEMISAVDWEFLIHGLQTKSFKDNLKIIRRKVGTSNMEDKTYIKEFIQYLIKHKEYALGDEWIALFKSVWHNEMVKTRYLVRYFVSSLMALYKEL